VHPFNCEAEGQQQVKHPHCYSADQQSVVLCRGEKMAVDVEQAAEGLATVVGAITAALPSAPHPLQEQQRKQQREQQVPGASRLPPPDASSRQQVEGEAQQTPRISHRDPHLQLSGLASGNQANTQPGTKSAPMLHPGRAVAAVDSGLPVSAESDQRQSEGSHRQLSPAQAAGGSASAAQQPQQQEQQEE
jgi:hypothetical protein